MVIGFLDATACTISIHHHEFTDHHDHLAIPSLFAVLYLPASTNGSRSVEEHNLDVDADVDVGLLRPSPIRKAALQVGTQYEDG